MARHSLPGMTALRSLEALDRLGSGSAAAMELGLSASAVSRQLSTLERQLGTRLMRRDGRRLQLTAEARAYASKVREALDLLNDAALAMRLPRHGGAINLAILPSFGMRWLVPRLPDFARRHPDITVNLSTRLRPFDFGTEGFDAAIHFGDTDWPGTDRLTLMTETVLPVRAPSDEPAPARPQDLAAHVRLVLQSRPEAWSRWFQAQGLDAPPRNGPSFDQFTTMIQAARHGLGTALLPLYLIEEDLAAGTLVPAATSAPTSLGSYALVWPRSRVRHPALRLFRDWMATQADPDESLPR